MVSGGVRRQDKEKARQGEGKFKTRVQLGQVRYVPCTRWRPLSTVEDTGSKKEDARSSDPPVGGTPPIPLNPPPPPPPPPLTDPNDPDVLVGGRYPFAKAPTPVPTPTPPTPPDAAYRALAAAVTNERGLVAAALLLVR